MSDFNICSECNKDKQDYFGCWTCRDYGIKLAERKRIIKLLEIDAGDWHEIAERCEAGYCHCNAIALIKENNEN